MPDSYQKATIVVNIPDKDFEIGVTMNVVVGKACGGHNTPVFNNTIQYVEQASSESFRIYFPALPPLEESNSSCFRTSLRLIGFAI